MTMIPPGTITDANPGPALYAVIETAALADGWTLDDTVVIGSTTHKVLKSAAAGNAQGKDWYLDINYPTTGVTGGMRFAPFEGYTAASDVGLRGPFGHASSTTLDATTYSRYGATTSALETNWLNGAGATALSMTLTTVAFNYWISITRNRIIAFTSIQATKAFYSGFFTPNAAHTAWAGASMFPLVMLSITSASTAQSSSALTSASLAFTRAPKASTIQWSASGVTTAVYDNLGWFSSGQVGVAASEFTGLTQLCPLPVIMGTNNGGVLTSNVGALDGLAAGVVLSSAVRGDTVTVGTDTWYATTPSLNQSLFMKAA